MFHILDETNAHLVWKKKTPQKPTHTNLKNQAKSIKIMQWCRKQIDSVCRGGVGVDSSEILTSKKNVFDYGYV